MRENITDAEERMAEMHMSRNLRKKETRLSGVLCAGADDDGDISYSHFSQNKMVARVSPASQRVP